MMECALCRPSIMDVYVYFLSDRRVGGQEYYGVAKEKAAAREEYEDRVNSGENVGLVESRYTGNILV